MKQTLKKILRPFERFILIELMWMLYKFSTARNSNPKLRSLSWLIRKNIELIINRMKTVRSDNSFANEATTLNELLEKIEIKNKFLIDIGAADGIRQSSTVMFLDKYSWNGALFESDSDSFAKLAYLYIDREDLRLCKSKVTPFNIVGLLESLIVPRDFGYLNIDIDSYDLSVIREILNSGFSPSIISMEINENFPPEIQFEVLYNENHAWESNHFFGCSLSAATIALEKFGYSLIRVEYNNVFFVRDIDALLFSLPPSVRHAYNDGYLHRDNRFDLFPWNTDMEFLHSEASVDIKVAEVNRLFSKYIGKYLIKAD